MDIRYVYLLKYALHNAQKNPIVLSLCCL